jgi:hypothetical protein
MLTIFFNIKGIVRKNFVLADQTVNSAYYCDVLRRLSKNVRRLRPEGWRQKSWLLHHDNAPSHTSSFARKFLTKNNMTVITTYPTRHIDTIEVIEAESEVVLNTFTEHDFQDAF